MKRSAVLLLGLAAIAILGTFYYAENYCSQEQRIENMKSILPEDSLLACSLTNSELVERKAKLLPEIRPFVEHIEELENGYSFQFPNDDDLLSKLLLVVQLESRCCSFLEFTLKVEANKGPIWLQFTGPKGAKEFIKEEFMSN